MPKKVVPERRKHKRFLVIHDVAEPVDLALNLPAIQKPVPAIITDFSAGGMALVTFVPIPKGVEMVITLNLPGIQGVQVEGKVVHTRQRGEVTRLGINFIRISTVDAQRINRMAEDYNDCETKLSLGVRDVCFRECAYWDLCRKPVKLD